MGEFNVNKTTGGLEQTAGMPSEYPANKVMMSDGVTNVEDRLDANTVGTSVDISSYSSTNKYTCPSDGYIYLNAGAQTNSNILANVADVNNTTIGAVYATASNIPYNMIYVKKGFKVFATANNGGIAYYKPLA